MTMAQSCGVRGCAASFDPLSEDGNMVLDDRARTFFALCRQHYRWLCDSAPSTLDDGAIVPGSMVLRAGPRRSDWLHDHCLPTLHLGAADQPELAKAAAERRAAERWPSA